MIPYTTQARPDTGVDNVTLGFWLFIASEVMLFGALFSSYVLLRVSATDWPAAGSLLHVGLGWINTVILFWITVVAVRMARSPWAIPRSLLIVTSARGRAVMAIKGVEYRTEWQAGLVPATSTFMAMYYTLTGIHALHVAGGIVANFWVLAGTRSVGEAMTAGRLKALGRYWIFVDLVWLVIFVGVYLR